MTRRMKRLSVINIKKKYIKFFNIDILLSK